VTENEISKVIVDCAIEVHRELGGPGLIESVYEEAMMHELLHRGMKVGRQVPAPIIYKGYTLGTPLSA
jgi:GxxExxY protein